MEDKNSSLTSRNKNLYQLYQCKTYKNQNPTIYISLSAMLMMQIHSHLIKNEVIGFLAGYSQKQSRHFKNQDGSNTSLIITEAYPLNSLNKKTCKSYNDNFPCTNEQNVEMCPESATKEKIKIDRRKQQILGWYHSHPQFQPQPSLIDIQNHQQYQDLFKKDSNNFFIGAIVSPYHYEKKKSDGCQLNWRELSQTTFYQIEGKQQPYDLKFKLLPEQKIKKRVLDDIYEICRTYLENYKSEQKIDFKQKFNKQLNSGQKLIALILELFLKNLELLNSDIDNISENLDLLDFSKEYKYKLKQDGSIIWRNEDQKNRLDKHFKTIQIDDFDEIQLFTKKLKQIILKNQKDSKQDNQLLTQQNEHLIFNKIQNLCEDNKSQQSEQQEIQQNEIIKDKKSQYKQFDTGKIICHDKVEKYNLIDIFQKNKKSSLEEILFKQSTENKFNGKNSKKVHQ